MHSSLSFARAPALRPVALATALLALHLGAAQAQATAAAVPASSTPADAGALPAVTVSASGLQLGSNDMATPVNVLEGDDLVRRREATLGDTLAGEPGITASHFGAGASRPIIRGMDGPRVLVLSDGAELHDASTISPDHAVVSEPLLARQVEVLRGPSALIHGGVGGGVVNVLDGKVPTAIPDKGYEGSAEVRASSAAREGAGAFQITGGQGNLALHVEGVARDAGDYRVGSGWSEGRKVQGSFNRTHTGSVGLSWVGEQGYLGAAFTRQNARYGLPGHNHSFEGCHTHGNHLHCGMHGPDDGHDHGDHDDHDHAHGDEPIVDLRSQRWDVRGELRNPWAGFSAIRLRAGVTDYAHDEIDEGTVSTAFRNKAHDARVELQHEPIAGWRGVFGVHAMHRDFRADGAEAYVEPTLTRRTGLFMLEEYQWGQDWRFEAALRHERQSIDAATRNISRSHNGTSASLGAVWKFTPGYALSASLTHAARLPTAEELYANGLHMATSTYERGNPQLRRETSRNIDVTLRRLAGDTTFSLGAFHHRVKDYIYGRTLDELHGLQLLQYSQANATFTGIEAQLRQRLTRNLGVAVFGDMVRAKLQDGAMLPRIPAARAGLRLDATWQQWEGQAEWVQVARQNRIAAYETPTPGYGMLNLGLAYKGRLGSGQTWQVYAKGNNLTNRLAFAHTSFIKNAAPLMGRNITVGMKLDF